MLEPLRSFIREYEWVHTSVGLLGNLLFFVASTKFLQESTRVAGTWMFIVGSAFMLLGSVGNALVTLNNSDRTRLRISTS
jgi:hypothetical protein